MRHVAGLLLLSGCQLVFALEDVETCPLPVEVQCGIADPDEDGDNKPDDCDPCPQAAGEESDTDGDGIADACDPVVGTAARCNIRRFLGLETGAGWLDTTGWTFDGSAESESPTLLVLRSEELRGTGRVETVIADQNPIQPDSLAGVVLFAGEGSGFLCALHPRDGGVGTLILAELVDGEERLIDEKPDGNGFSITPGRSHRVQLTIGSDGRVVCRSQDVNGSGVEAEIEADVMRPVAGSFGIAVRGLVDDQFRYVDFIPD